MISPPAASERSASPKPAPTANGCLDAPQSHTDLVLTAPGLSVIARAIEEARRINLQMDISSNKAPNIG